MSFIVVGLGNPGKEYQHTRHNTGRWFVEYFGAQENFPPFAEDNKLSAQNTESRVGKEQVRLVLPDAYMNKSGDVLKSLIKEAKRPRIVVAHDDLDLPLGTFKLSFGRGAAGHRGVESIIKSLGTKDFVRFRIGVGASGVGGKLRKLKGEKKILDYLMKSFTKKQMEVLKKIAPELQCALKLTITEGHVAAMNSYN